jgi:hypothetical protein
MARKNSHVGSSFESWLDQEDIREEVTAAAIKSVFSRQLVNEMKKKKITKPRMAELMKTSRAQIDRLLDPDNGSATIECLQRAARIVGRELRLQLAFWSVDMLGGFRFAYRLRVQKRQNSFVHRPPRCMAHAQDQNFIILDGVENQIRIAPHGDHPHFRFVFWMAHLGKATELHGYCTNASNDLAGCYWIALVDVSENRVKLRERGLGESDLHAGRYLANTASTS